MKNSILIISMATLLPNGTMMLVKHSCLLLLVLVKLGQKRVQGQLIYRKKEKSLTKGLLLFIILNR